MERDIPDVLLLNVYHCLHGCNSCSFNPYPGNIGVSKEDIGFLMILLPVFCIPITLPYLYSYSYSYLLFCLPSSYYPPCVSLYLSTCI
jgi:hypothetical protein